MTTTVAKRPKAAKPAEQSTMEFADPMVEVSEVTTSNSTKSETKPLASESIGEAAGAIWAYLDAAGPQPIAKLKKAVDAPADTVLAAIGWLAREGKLSFEANGKSVTISLA